MTTKTYNGWKNRATWNTALWLTNEYGLYTSMRTHFTCNRINRDTVEEFVTNLWPCGHTPDGDDLNDVHWPEIAAMIREDLA